MHQSLYGLLKDKREKPSGDGKEKTDTEASKGEVKGERNGSAKRAQSDSHKHAIAKQCSWTSGVFCLPSPKTGKMRKIRRKTRSVRYLLKIINAGKMRRAE